MPATQEARAKEIVAQLSAGTASSEDVFAAFEELDHLPADVVKSALEPWLGPAPDPERLDDTLRRAHRLPLRAPRLRVLSSMRDADILDLGEIPEAQIKLAGKTWDGLELDAFERLDGERGDTWAGSLERRVLGEQGDKPLYDAILFATGAVVFRSGTTQVIAVVADNRVESTDKVARPALELALRDHIFEEPSEDSVPSTVSATPVATPPPASMTFPDAPPPPSMEPVPATVAVHVPTRDSRQVELPFEGAPPTTPSRVPSQPKKKAAAKAKAAPASEPAPKKKAAAKAKAEPAPKKKAAAKAKAEPAPKKKAAAKAKAEPAPKKAASKAPASKKAPASVKAPAAKKKAAASKAPAKKKKSAKD